MRLILLVPILVAVFAIVVAHEDHEDSEEAEVHVDEDVPQAPASVEVDQVNYASPTPSGQVYFAEHFDNPEEFEARWTRSQAKKDGADDEIAKYNGKFQPSRV